LPELPDAKKDRFIKQYNLSLYQAEILTESKIVAGDFENQVKTNKAFSPLEIANSIINKRPLTAKLTGEVDEGIIKRVLASNPQAVFDYKNGKIQVLGYLIGQCAKLMPDVEKIMIKNNLEVILSE
jgi:Asp-tRNA(Asn)/Glu-tRNA(Gln) amidotransferase B subunit